jgi:putative transposase
VRQGIEDFVKSINPSRNQRKAITGVVSYYQRLVVEGKNKASPGQMRLPWDDWEVADSEVREVAEQFVTANCYDPRIAAQLFK